MLLSKLLKMTKKNFLSQTTLSQLKKIAEEIIENKKELRLGTTSLTPINYTVEMEKFLKSNTYNPIFKYSKNPLKNYRNKISDLKKNVDSLNFPDDLKEHFFGVLEEQEVLYQTKRSIGKEGFSNNARKLFDWGTDRLDTLLTTTPKVSFHLYASHIMQNAPTIKQRFQETLNEYGIKSLKPEIDTFTTHIINVGYKKIGIGSAIKRFECNVDRLITHEIESHVLQVENMKRSRNPLLELSKYGNANLFSEGLAVYNEIITRAITPSAFETYYNRIKAVRMLNKSFREIFETLAEDLPIKKAYVMTYRVKRGLKNTKEPGGFPKDAAYLLGFHEVENLINEGYDRKLLYVTKSPVLTQLLKKYNLLDDKKILIPRFYR